jgi:hypothetical protein
MLLCRRTYRTVSTVCGECCEQTACTVDDNRTGMYGTGRYGRPTGTGRSIRSYARYSMALITNLVLYRTLRVPTY